MSITALVTPEEVASALTAFGQRLAPAFRTALARQSSGDYTTMLRAALGEAVRDASNGAFAMHPANADVVRFFNPLIHKIAGGVAPTETVNAGHTADPATEKTVSEQLSPDTATNTAPYRALDIAKASAKEVEEHANGLHVELQAASAAFRTGQVTPAQVAEMGRMVKNAMHFYDKVVERADASGDPKEVEALFNYRFRRLASDLPAYETQVDSARIGLDRK